MGQVFGLGLARVVYLHGRHSASVVGAVLEGGSVVPGVEGMVGIEVGVADGALQHSAKSCTWGLAQLHCWWEACTGRGLPLFQPSVPHEFA